MSTNTLLYALCLAGFTAASANATILIDSVFGAADGDGNDSPNSFNIGNNSDYTFTVNASGSDKLVVFVSGEHGNPGDGNGNSIGVTYDGTALTEVVDQNPFPGPGSANQNYLSVYILDNPGAAHTAGQLAVDNNQRGVTTVFLLSGTLPGVGATVQTDKSNPEQLSVNITTTAANSLVLGGYGVAGTTNTAQTSQNGVGAGLNLESNLEQGSNWNGLATASATVASPSTFNVAFTDTDTGGAGNVVAVEFLAVPEPSSLALLVLGGLLTARRLRRT